MAGAALLFFLAVVATATFAQSPVKWNKLRVKWTFFGQLGQYEGYGFFEIPLTTDAASKGGWAQAASTNFTTIWCLEEDPRVCPLYDMQGTVAGMQISLPVKNIFLPGNGSVDNHPMLFKNNMYNRDLYSARYYLVDQATLAAGGRPPSDEVGTGLWLQNGTGLIEVPRDGDLLAAQGWTLQTCRIFMGRHYYYNMSKDMSCEDLQPFFLLANNQNNYLHGVGLQMIGKASVKKRKWFDKISTTDIYRIAPDTPLCLKDLTETYGVIFLHMYFVDNPYLIKCKLKI